MRFGGPVFGTSEPDSWVEAHRQAGYTATYWPEPSEDLVDEYVAAARRSNLVIAEVGAWSNPLSRDEATRKAAFERCVNQLALADRVGARCCVNIVGSRGEKWDGPCAEDLLPETFDAIVETTRAIIDAVQPSRTFYTLETMPWMLPDSADSYLRLIEAIDRPACAVHLDPTNLVNCPARYFRNGDLIRECFEKLGPRIRSCHAKDILMGDRFMVHIDEVPPGQGTLDYRVYLTELARLDPDTPLMMEHMTPEQFPPAAAYIRKVAADCGVSMG